MAKRNKMCWGCGEPLLKGDQKKVRFEDGVHRIHDNSRCEAEGELHSKNPKLWKKIIPFENRKIKFFNSHIFFRGGS